MNRIDGLVQMHCPQGVAHVPLAEFAELVRGNGMPRSELTDSGVGAIHYGQIYTRYGVWATETSSFVTPESARALARVDTGDLIITNTSENLDDVGKAVAWLGAEPIVTGGHATVIKHDQDPKFLSYWFRSPSFTAQKRTLATGTKVIDVSAKQLAKVVVPLPPIAVQHEIAQVLDRFTELEMGLEAELEAEFHARRRQYVYWRARLVAPTGGGEVRTVLLGDAVEMQAGQFIPAAEISPAQDPDHPYPCYGGNGIRGYVATYNREGEAVLIGRQGALSGNVKRVRGKFYATEHAIVATTSADIDVPWLFHMLSEMNLNQYVSQGAQPGLAVGNLRRVPMVVPALEAQHRAAGILDRLAALVHDLSTGLPAELSARRTQYEYYRDKLLTFPEAVA